LPTALPARYVLEVSLVRTVTNEEAGGRGDLRSARTTIRRLPERGGNDRATVHAVLDAARICHLGFTVDDQPFVIPTILGRDGDTLYVHGSPASRMLRTLKRGVRVCLTATVVDGLVLARSVFHHSMNYRSAVVLGRAVAVDDPERKRHGLRVITEHVLAGRWDEVRHPNDKELRGTTVLSLPIEEASVKVRVGPPVDDDEDYALPVWAGVLPLTSEVGMPIPEPRLAPGIDVSPSVAAAYAGD
jgi:nitroimidazol reductase NimA-like FMN-containing flavoprotein (pyridoxamine 5'-phosphate oxidase superfamily)